MGAYPLPRLDQKVLSRLAEYDDIIRGTLSTLPWAPNPKSTTVNNDCNMHLTYSQFGLVMPSGVSMQSGAHGKV